MFVSTGVEGLDELIPGFPRGGLIIVTGRPGTGKTVFSASFLYNGAVKSGEKGLYISLVEDRESFLENMKSLGMDFEELEKRRLFSFAEFLTMREEASRSTLAEIINTVEEERPQRLVVDSFSAAVHYFKDPREIRVFLHSIFMRVAKRLKCTTILIEEVPYGNENIGYGFEEFIASGIIILRSRIADGRLIREIAIPKLRGARIECPVSCFTIYKGVKVFSPHKPLKTEPKFVKPLQPLPEPPERYSTGMRELDEALGGIKKGSTILVDLSPEVTFEQYHLIVDALVFNYMSAADRPILVIPSAGVSWEDVSQTLKDFGMPEENFERVLRVIEPGKEVRESLPPYVVKWKPESPIKDFEKLVELEDSLIRSTGYPPLRFIGVDRVVHYHGQEGALTLANLDVTRTKKLRSLTLWLFKAIYPELLKRLIPLASIHMKIAQKNGCLLLYCVKPRTPLYVVERDLSRGYPLPKLFPIE